MKQSLIEKIFITFFSALIGSILYGWFIIFIFNLICFFFLFIFRLYVPSAELWFSGYISLPLIIMPIAIFSLIYTGSDNSKDNKKNNDIFKQIENSSKLEKIIIFLSNLLLFGWLYRFLYYSWVDSTTATCYHRFVPGSVSCDDYDSSDSYYSKFYDVSTSDSILSAGVKFPLSFLKFLAMVFIVSIIYIFLKKIYLFIYCNFFNK